MPKHIVIVTDNTVAQAKNGVVALFESWLVSAHKFDTVDHLSLTVGHTHEDIDQLFAVLMHILLQYGHYETPEEMLEILCQGLREKVAAKHEQLIAKHLTSVRNWAAWLAYLDMGLSNCWANRGGLEAAHSFSYKLYQKLSTADLVWLSHDETLAAHPMDVYCCIKAYMHLGRFHTGFRMQPFWHG